MAAWSYLAPTNFMLLLGKPDARIALRQLGGRLILMFHSLTLMTLTSVNVYGVTS